LNSNAKSSTYIIGDIHGALKGLVQLLARVDPGTEDTLIFLGDYVDGWSQSAEVIEHLIALAGKHNCIFLKGNHDAWCEDWLATQKADRTWLQHGGQATVASYSQLSDERKTVHLAFFNRMLPYYTDNSHRLFIHAGFSSMHGPDHERYASNYFWDRTLWEMALSVDSRLSKDSRLYPKRLLLYDEIYIGHTPTLNYNIDVPMQACNVWNIDTGAAFYGPLSAIELGSKKIFQSDIIQNLYPTEKGRNK
jgi:serine/threonine protein phosphatase 1